MDQALETQYAIKQNAEQLQNILKELEQWERDMKVKDLDVKTAVAENKAAEAHIPPPRTELQKQKEEKRTTVRSQISSVTLQDPGQNSKLKSSNIDEAFFEKQEGNRLVKEGKWSEAINCYSRAIELDPENAIYYANRALCQMKLSRFKEAEVDSTIAIQLDEKYVKAYQRRGFARKALNQLQEALADYRHILKLEPNNVAAQAEIDGILSHLSKMNESSSGKEAKVATFNPKKMFQTEKTEKRQVNLQKEPVKSVFEPKNIFKEKDKKPEDKINKKKDNREFNETKLKDSPRIFKEIPEGLEVVNVITKSPHLRSTNPLQKVVVHSVKECRNPDNPVPFCQEETKNKVEAKVESVSVNEQQVKKPQLTIDQLEVPQTFAQFKRTWEDIYADAQLTYQYLKKISAAKLPEILGIQIESDIFSEIISVLVNIKDAVFISDCLMNFTKIPRLQSLLLFASDKDTENLRKCMEQIENTHVREELGKKFKC